MTAVPAEPGLHELTEAGARNIPRPRLAMHEAGHSAARIALSEPFEFATIDGLPHVETIKDRDVRSGPYMAWMTAGMISEYQAEGCVIRDADVLRLLLGSPDGLYSWTREATGEQLTKTRVYAVMVDEQGARGDLWYVAERMLRKQTPPQEAVAFWRACEDFTRQLRPGVDAIAAELLARGRVEYDRARELFAGAMAGKTVQLPPFACGYDWTDELSAEAGRQLLAAHDGLAAEDVRQVPRARALAAVHEAAAGCAMWALRVAFDRCDLDCEPVPATIPLPGTVLPNGVHLAVTGAGHIAWRRADGFEIADDQIIAFLRGTPPVFEITNPVTGEVRHPYSLPAVGGDLRGWCHHAWTLPQPLTVQRYRDCEQFVASIRPAIAAVAGHLDARRVLTCAEIGELAAAAMKDEPAPLIPGWAGELVTDRAACYTLSDPSGSTSASESSGNGGAPLRMRTYGTGATLTFGGSGGPIGSAAPGFTSSPLSSLVSAVGFPSGWTGNIQLEGPLLTPVSAAAGFTFEIWSYLTLSALTPAQIMVPICLVNSRTQACVCPALSYVSAGTGNPAVGVSPGPSGVTPLYGFGTATTSRLLHWVVTVTGTTASLYLNGAASATATHAIPAQFTADYLIVNGVPGGASGLSSVSSGVTGALNCAAVVPSVLTSTQISQHWTAGSGQNYGQPISTLIGNILRYAGIPAALYTIDTGASYADAYEINGQTPLSMIQ